MFKPFKSPLLVKRPGQPQQSKREASNRSDGPPLKKRKASQNDQQDETYQPQEEQDVVNSQAHRRPLIHAKTSAVNLVAESPPAKKPGSLGGQYTALWRKKTNKKNKTWDGDGFVTVRDGYATLRDTDGSSLGKTSCKVPLLPGSTLTIGGKEVEIDSVMSKQETEARAKAATSQPRPVFSMPRTQPLTATKNLHTRPDAPSGNIHSRAAELPRRVNAGFKNPMKNNNPLRATPNDKVPVPRHDPNAEGALVMKRPESVPSGKRVVDVVVDPMLTKNLRAHQREGVAFMYECVMGMRPFDGEGAILADEMGLGKTLQTIALLWTLLKQNPIYEDQPVIKKALIVCPATLINNWRIEFRKWLGNERIGVMVAESNKTRFTDFTKGKSYNIMIIGYEKLRNVQAELQKGHGIDIVIADEGHRLKTAQNKSAMAIKSLNTERRIILSGTPIQNDLSEFYTMVDFVNPGLLNKYTTFKKDFETPILKSRQPGASAKDLEKGQAQSSELATLTGQFILRRTADILAQYLPPKTEYVVFCRPTAVQVACYDSIVSTGVFDRALNNSETSFQLINILKKVCNNPRLLLKKAGADEDGQNATITAITEAMPIGHLKSSAGSSKLHVLDTLLHNLHTTTSEKVVVVSNYTATLDLLAKLMTALDYPFLRLDGSTPVAQRQNLVDTFNKSPVSKSFVFLLSAKAGGVGINLIGASRLVLYDIDWNPAVDLQAMARIHRDGQKRPCYIYRLLTKGAIEEKIYQRQLSKMDLSDTIVDNKVTASTFSPEELRDLFSLDRRESCQTHDSLSCRCGGRRATAIELSSGVPSPKATEGDPENEGGEDGEEIEKEDNDEDNEEDELPELPRFIRSSQVDVEALERRREERRKAEQARFEKGQGKLQSLMKYAHIDTTLFREKKKEKVEIEKASLSSDNSTVGGDEEKELEAADVVIDVDDDDDELTLETAIEDVVLRAVVSEEGSRVDFVFAKTNV